MKKIIKLGSGILLSTLFIIGNAHASTIVSGDITTDTTWTESGSPYILSNIIQVAPGATLTIDPGTTIQFDPSPDNQSVFIADNGTIKAQGDIDNPVKFNGVGLYFYSASSTLRNLSFENAGSAISLFGGSHIDANNILVVNTSGKSSNSNL